jgi:drug/metabolite transporter (DMT)-like permease
VDPGPAPSPDDAARTEALNPGDEPTTLSRRSRRERAGSSYPALLGVLALSWGSSYLFIKIGVATLPPLSLVAGRLFVGLAVLLVVAGITRTPFPRDRRTVGGLAVLGAVNIAIPFWLIGWAEQHITSGLTGILQSTSPFFTLVLAATFLHDERVTRGRVTGIALGFLGIFVLSANDLADVASAAGAQRLLAELAVVLASLAYGTGNTFARRDTRPLVLATGQVGWAFAMIVGLAFLVDGGITVPAVPEAALAVAWLGAVGTGFAYVVYFRLLAGWGPTRTSLVAYLLPVVAVLLGIVVLGETVDATFLAGAAFIVAGIWVVNRRG